MNIPSKISNRTTAESKPQPKWYYAFRNYGEYPPWVCLVLSFVIYVVCLLTFGHDMRIASLGLSNVVVGVANVFIGWMKYGKFRLWRSSAIIAFFMYLVFLLLVSYGFAWTSLGFSFVIFWFFDLNHVVILEQARKLGIPEENL